LSRCNLFRVSTVRAPSRIAVALPWFLRTIYWLQLKIQVRNFPNTQIMNQVGFHVRWVCFQSL